jgi:hypothetical protein
LWYINTALSRLNRVVEIYPRTNLRTLYGGELRAPHPGNFKIGVRSPESMDPRASVGNLEKRISLDHFEDKDFDKE